MNDFKILNYNFIQLLESNNIRGYATTLDFNELEKVTPTIAKFSKGDINVDAIAIQLLYNGEKIPFEIGTDCYANIKRNDGKTIKNPVEILDSENGSIAVYLKDESVQSVGISTLEVVLTYVDASTKENKKIISSKISFAVFDQINSLDCLDKNKLTLLSNDLKTLSDTMDEISKDKVTIDIADANNKGIIFGLNRALKSEKEIIENANNVIEKSTIEIEKERDINEKMNSLKHLTNDYQNKVNEVNIGLNTITHNSFTSNFTGIQLNDVLGKEVSNLVIYGNYDNSSAYCMGQDLNIVANGVTNVFPLTKYTSTGLSKILDSCDYIDFKNNKIVKNIYDKDCSTLSWVAKEKNNGYTVFGVDGIAKSCNITEIGTMCGTLTPATSQNQSTIEKDTVCVDDTGALLVRIADSETNGGTVDGFIKYLQSLSIGINFIMATPYEISIVQNTPIIKASSEDIALCFIPGNNIFPSKVELDFKLDYMKIIKDNQTKLNQLLNLGK